MICDVRADIQREFTDAKEPPHRGQELRRRAALLKREGIKVAMLVPAAIDTIWWRDWVHDRALVIPVSRMAFVGAKDVFPKPLALCLYSPIEPPDYKPLWRWKQDQPGADS